MCMWNCARESQLSMSTKSCNHRGCSVGWTASALDCKVRFQRIESGCLHNTTLDDFTAPVIQVYGKRKSMWMLLGCDQEKQKIRQVFDQWTVRPGEYWVASPSPGKNASTPCADHSRNNVPFPGPQRGNNGGVVRPNATKRRRVGDLTKGNETRIM